MVVERPKDVHIFARPSHRRLCPEHGLPVDTMVADKYWTCGVCAVAINRARELADMEAVAEALAGDDE